MRLQSLCLVLFGVACGGAKESDPAPTTGETPSVEPTPGADSDNGEPAEPSIVEPSDAPYLDDSGDQTPPELDETVLGAAVDAALLEAIATHGAPAVEAYFEMLDESDGVCPRWAVSGDTPYWFDSCTTEGGTTFDGYGYHQTYAGPYDGGVTWYGRAMYSVARIVGADGRQFDGAGGAGFLTGTDASGNDVWYSYVQSGFSYDGPAAEGTWLAEGLDPELTWYALRAPSGIGAAVTLSGSARTTGDAVEVLVFNDLLLIDEAFGSSCPEEPNGSISVLDGEGHWFDLYFDGPTWGGDATPEDLCDGCAAAWFGGAYVGEVCVDFSPLSDWDGYPFASE